MIGLLTSLAFMANALAFGLITYRSIAATIVHVQNGTPNNGMLTLATAFVAFFIMAVSAMPTARANFTAMIDTRLRRFLVRLLVPFLLFITGIGVTFVLRSDSRFVFGILPEVYLFGAFGIYALLMIVMFAVPGLAFPELQEVRRQQKAGFGYQAVSDERYLPTERVIPRWIKALLVPPGLVLFSMIIAFLYGREADFLPLPEHVNQIEGLRTKILTVFIPLFGVLGFFAANKPGKWIFRHRAVQLPVLVIVCGACGFFVPFAITNGLPALHSLVSTAPRVEQEVLVAKRGQSIRSKACDRTAEVTWPGAVGYSQTLCDVPRDLWNTLVPGDRLLITGPRTEYGQRYDTIVRM